MGVKVREYKPGAWWLLIDHKGQRKAKKIGSKKAAMEAAVKIEAAIAANTFHLPSPHERGPVLLKEYAAKWMDGHVKTNLKPSTRHGYRHLLENHILPVFGSRPLAEIARDEIKALCYRKIQEGLSASTVSYLARTLSAIFNHAVEDGVVVANPASRPGRYIKLGNRLDKISFLTPDEGRVLLDAAQKKALRHYALLLVALRTGMRQGEIIGLQWGDIDWNGNFIEIRRTNWKGHMTTPKSGKARRCDMSDQLAEVLQDHKRRIAAEALAKGRPLPSWVFPSDAGTMLDASNIRKMFDGCLTLAGLRKIRFHDLRHSFASWLIANGESLAYVKGQMGHHSIQITVDTYGHLVPGANRQAVNRLDDPNWRGKDPVPSRPQRKREQVHGTGRRPILTLVDRPTDQIP